MIRALAVALLAIWIAGCRTPRAAPAMPAADPRTASTVPPRAANGGGQPEERHRRVRGAAAAIDLGDFGLDLDHPRPAPPAPPAISADERATLDAIEEVARLFAQDLPPAELHRRIGRDASAIEGGVALVPRAAPLTSIVAWSISRQLTLRLRNAITPTILETRFGPFQPCCLDNREYPKFDAALRDLSGAYTVDVSLLYAEPVGADWRDDPIHEVDLLRRPVRRE